MKFINEFEELESLLNLEKMLLFCRDRNGLHSKALKTIEFGLPSASALMEEGLAWKRVKEEALEEVAIGEMLKKKCGTEKVKQMTECLRREGEELRRSYRKSLKERLSTVLQLERSIQLSVHEASIESFRRRHLMKLHRNSVVCSTCPEGRRRSTPSSQGADSKSGRSSKTPGRPQGLQ